MSVMAKYSVDSVNYVTVGKTEKILNLDISLADESKVLVTEEIPYLAIASEDAHSLAIALYEDSDSEYVSLKN